MSEFKVGDRVMIGAEITAVWGDGAVDVLMDGQGASRTTNVYWFRAVSPAPAGEGLRKVWAVNQRYSLYVSHDFEPIAFFSTPELAEQFRTHCEEAQAQKLIDHAEYYKTSTKPDYTFDVEEWDVDDSVLNGEGER